MWITVRYFLSKEGKEGFAFETNRGNADNLVLKIIENNSDKEIIVRMVAENSAWTVEKYEDGKTKILDKNKMFDETEDNNETKTLKNFSKWEEWEEWNTGIGYCWYSEFDKLSEDKNYVPKFDKLKDEWFK